MSIWSSDQQNAVEDSSEFIRDLSKKAYSKIDSLSKLQVIQALEDGQSKSDVAREYCVHPQIIAQISKQKDSIIKKYTQKYNLLKQVNELNIEQKLLDWIGSQIASGKIITEECLHDQTLELIKPLNDKFTCINDWLHNFRMRHNMSKFSSLKGSFGENQDNWKKYIDSEDSAIVYLGGVCALSYNLEFNSYLKGCEADNYVSIFFITNTLGTDKRELLVVGKDPLEAEQHVRSLPISYYYCSNGQVNHPIIFSYLTKWNNELVSKSKSITLVLDIPDSLVQNLQFGNIKIVSTTNLCYATNIVVKTVECFKYHYRKLQIGRSLTYGKDSSSFLNYIHMIGMAWYNVPQRYMQSLSLLSEHGLYLNNIENSDNEHSLSQWCKIKNIPLNIEESSTLLDKYIYCDKDLPCIYCGQLEKHMVPIEVLAEKSCQSTSGMEAYQAMKRLVCYLQGESASGPIIKYAKYLENHLEYGALLQMHQVIASTKDSV